MYSIIVNIDYVRRLQWKLPLRLQTNTHDESDIMGLLPC